MAEEQNDIQTSHPLNRGTLKNLFSNGNRPTEGSFAKLIDSTVNKVEDGFSKDESNGLMLSPEGTSIKLASFYKSIADNPLWSIQLGKEEKKQGLNFTEPGEESDETRLYIQAGGNVGIGTNDPQHKLHVNGYLGVDGRIGTFLTGEVPANGQWQTIIPDLSGCNAFELIAKAGKKGEGMYGLTYATAVNTFGKKQCRSIRKTQSRFGAWRNKITVRWQGSTYDYSLQVRTKRNYGDGVNIQFYVSKLWSDEDFGIPVKHKESDE